jgi:3-hydroxy acid dehydrogenase/malonic semialdehyde reductase
MPTGPDAWRTDPVGAPEGGRVDLTACAASPSRPEKGEGLADGEKERVVRDDLAGKRVAVTGATSGIGAASAALLAQAGASILIVGRDAAGLADRHAELRHCPGEIFSLAADIATEKGVADLFRAVDDKLGGLDVMLCAAALGAEPIHEMAEGAWRYVVETNLVGTLACARGAIERMEDGGGHILFIGSISSEIKAVGESVYAATKAGVQAFAETLRKEVAPLGIRVSVVQPGSTSTPMQTCSESDKDAAVAREAMLEAEDVAEAVLFVLTRSRRADVVTLRIEPRCQKTH